jgi:2-haloacid dehalogenase
MGTIGCDVYGTLVDPLQMNEHMRGPAGEKADQLATLWRQKQLEYAFRRGLMRRYEDFSTCTRQALKFAAQSLGVGLSPSEEEQLLHEYQSLRPYPDVIPGIEQLKSCGYKTVAFSQGTERMVRELLENAGVLAYLDDVVSVDDLKTYKPSPEVYAYLAQRTGSPPSETWLISSNPWDVIGAKVSSLKAAWIKRRADVVFDPWGIEPDLVAPDLKSLAQCLGASLACGSV